MKYLWHDFYFWNHSGFVLSFIIMERYCVFTTCYCLTEQRVHSFFLLLANTLWSTIHCRNKMQKLWGVGILTSLNGQVSWLSSQSCDKHDKFQEANVSSLRNKIARVEEMLEHLSELKEMNSESVEVEEWLQNLLLSVMLSHFSNDYCTNNGLAHSSN